MTDPELRDAIRELDELVKYSAIATNDQKHAALYRVCRHLTNVLKTVTRSHPAPPPSPSDENAGEGASDEETPERLGVAAFIERGSPIKRWEQITHEERRAWMQAAWHGYEAGKKHQASADAATIAAWRPVSEPPTEHTYCLVWCAEWGYEVQFFDGEFGPMGLSGAHDPTHWHELPALPASLRPEPDELTDGPDPIHEGDR